MSRRLAAWVPAGLIAIGQAVGALSRPVHDRLADLHVYLGAVRELIDDGTLYDFITPNGAPFTYPPFAGLIMLPLALLDEPALRLLWTALTIVTVVLVAIVVSRAVEDRFPGKVRPWLAPGTAAALFASAPVSSNIRFGQVSALLALLVLVDLTSRRLGRGRGVLTGLAAATKLTPLIFLPLFWLGMHRRAAVTAAAAFVGAFAVAWLVLPSDSLRFWGTEIFNLNRVGNISTGGNQSINGALLRWGLADQPRTAIMLLAGLAVGALALWRARTAARHADWLGAAVIVGAASIVISPVSWTHHQIWLVLAIFLPVGGSARARWYWVVAVLATMIIPLGTLSAWLPGPVHQVIGESRLMLALAVSCAVPLRYARRGGERTVAEAEPIKARAASSGRRRAAGNPSAR